MPRRRSPITDTADQPPSKPLASVKRTPGVFNIALVGVVAGYPKTEQRYLERMAILRDYSIAAGLNGSKSRLGVPDGYTRKTAHEARVYADRQAAQILRTIMSRSLDPRERPDPTLAPTSDVSRAEIALTHSLAGVLGPACARQRRKGWDRFVQWIKAPGDRPKDMLEGYKWLLDISKPGCNQSYQMPIPGVPIAKSAIQLEGEAWLGSLIGK